MKQLTTFVHTMFCRMNHLTKMEDIRTNKDNPNVCLFYLEQVFEDQWERRDHIIWTGKTKKLLLDLDSISPAEAFNLLSKALAITRGVTPMINEHPNLKRIIIELLEVM